jgi:hypothetical protein
MKFRLESRKILVLELTEEEAKWLHAYVQNQIVPDQKEKDAGMRTLLF